MVEFYSDFYKNEVKCQNFGRIKPLGLPRVSGQNVPGHLGTKQTRNDNLGTKQTRNKTNQERCQLGTVPSRNEDNQEQCHLGTKTSRNETIQERFSTRKSNQERFFGTDFRQLFFYKKSEIVHTLRTQKSFLVVLENRSQLSCNLGPIFFFFKIQV